MFFFSATIKNPHMNNNIQQPFSSTGVLGAPFSNSSVSAMDQPSQKRRRLNSKQPAARLLIAERPAAARPLLMIADHAAGAAAAPPPPPVAPPLPPRIRVQESQSVRQLFTVTVDQFDPNFTGVEPINLTNDPLRVILENRIGSGTPFKLKVTIEWIIDRGPSPDEPVYDKYYMTFTAFKIPPTQPVLYGQPQGRFPMEDFMATVRQMALDKMKWAEDQGSAVRFVTISKVFFTAVPITRTLLTAGLGGCSVKLPRSLLVKQCVVNVTNKDNMCFRFAVLAWALDREHPESPHRPSTYYTNTSEHKGRPPKGFVPEFIDVGIDFSMLSYPVDTTDLEPFEETNDLGVYVFMWKESTTEGKGFAVQTRRPSRVFDRDIVLLLHEGHYMFVKNFNSFINLFGHRNNNRICHRCLYALENDLQLNKHLLKGQCLKAEETIAPPRLPKSKDGESIPKLYFNKQGDIFDHPCILFADFETYQQAEVEQSRGDHTKIISSMTGVASYGYFAVSSVPSIPTGGQIKRASADEFLLEMLKLGLKYRHHCINPAPMTLTAEEEASHHVASRCYLCKTSRLKLLERALANEAELALTTQRPARDITLLPPVLNRDHDHCSGLFRGSCCQSCNVKAQMPKWLVIFFHNLEGFDGHELIRAAIRLRTPLVPSGLEEDEDAEYGPDGDEPIDNPNRDPSNEPLPDDNFETGEINLDQSRISAMRFTILATSCEKYMQIQLGPIVFRDSFKFADSGLAKLIKSQRKTAPALADCFPLLAEHHPFMQQFPGNASLDLILQKVPMAYTSIVDSTYFDLPAVLPQSAYDDDLSGVPCSDRDFTLVETVVEHFALQDQGAYHDLYLWTDVLALADCMISLRKGWRAHCDLDMFNSVTLPSASYQAMLKMTGVRMELLCEDVGPGMELMDTLNRNVRGGVSCVFQPYAKANNPRVLPKVAPVIPKEQHDRIREGHETDWDSLPSEYIEWCKREGYDHEAEMSWIIYIDANSLYPTTMCMPLPIGDYKKLDIVEGEGVAVVKDILKAYTDNSRTGYFIEVDFEIPDHLHDVFDIAPVSKRVVEESDLSEHQHFVGGLLGSPAAAPKLVPFLGKHTKVLYHTSLLKFWADMGCVITKVYNVWSYSQSTWMAKYILGMARKRATSTDPVEREILKKAMNSLYGKMLQDKSKQRNLTPYTSARAFVRASSRDVCVNFSVKQYDSPGVGFFGLVETSKKGGALLDMPRAAGFAILDISKVLILRWHFHWFKEKFGSRCTVLLTDTDSLIYKITCRCIAEEMLASVRFDFDLQEGLSPSDVSRLCDANPHKIALLVKELAEHKGKLGAMKLENKTSFIQEYVGLASKMYSLKMIGHADHNGNFKDDGVIEDYRKGKGVPTRALLANTTHDTYKQMVFNPSVNRVKFRTLRSKDHVVQQLEIDRKMLTAYNDKVFAVSQFVSRPQGHWRNTLHSADEPADEPPAQQPSSSSSR